MKLWDAESGAELATLRLTGPLGSVATHPWRPRTACGDGSVGGAVYVVDLVGGECEPIIGAAAERDGRLVLCCPRCWHEHVVEPDQLGSVLTCPTSDCGLELRLNAFVLSGEGSG